MRIVSIVLVVVTLAAGANLLTNPGFEQWDDDSTPAGWLVEDRGCTAVQREADSCRSGVGAARLVRRELVPGNNYGISQRVPVTAGTDYRLSCWCRDDAGEVSAGIGVTWRRADSGYIGASGLTYSIDSAGWQPLADIATAPAGAALADFRLRTYAPAGMPAERRVLADDAFFGPVVAPPETVRSWFARDSLAERLIDFIDRAGVSLDYCHYNSSRSDVVQALLDAGSRGVAVRVITDDRRVGNLWVEQLRTAGIPVWTDSVSPRSSNYMHNKFAVLDVADGDTTNDCVWTASYNPNEGELRADCALEIPHAGIARAYRAEFEQMWGGTGMVPVPESARFHDAKVDVQATHQFVVNGSPVELYFAPQDRVVDTITARAEVAERHLIFGVYAFTWDDLGDAMINLWQAGKWVGGVLDRSGVNGTGSEYERLRAAGVPIMCDSVPFGEGIIHEKLMVVDSAAVIAGSANWSNNANRANDESTVVIHDAGIAVRFLAELEERFAEAGGPGVGERGAAFLPRPGRLVSPTTAARLPAEVAVFDAGGRLVRSRSALSPGVYFVRPEGGRAVPVVVVR